MPDLLNDIENYKNLFSNNDLSISEQSKLIQWSERKCYIFKYFISSLSEKEIELIRKSTVENDYELIAAICLHVSGMRLIILNQLDRIESSDSPFDEIQLIIQENSTPDPLRSISNQFWNAVHDYLIELDYDEYPFNKKGRGMLKSVARIGYKKLSPNQLKYLHGLIDNDRQRAETAHFFVNQYLNNKGFEKDCAIIKELWLNH